MENIDEKNQNNPTEGDSANDDKVIGILSYLGILWIVAYIIYNNKKSEYNIFHLRQGLGLLIIGIADMIVYAIPFIGWIIGFVVFIVIIVFMIMGIMAAANGEQKELPLIGKFISENLKSFK
jgi:uncharacterized membrane protein